MQDVLVSDAEQMEDGNMSKDHNHIHSQFHISKHRNYSSTGVPHTQSIRCKLLM